MLRSWLMRGLLRIKFVERKKGGSPCNAGSLNRFLRHRSDSDIPHLNITRFHLSAGYLGDKMVLVVRRHELRRERLRKEVIVQRVLLRNNLSIDGESVVCPIRQIGADLALTRTVVQVGVLNRLGASHVVNPDVAIGNRAMGK